MYEQPSSPAQSTTSLSDNDDEYINKSAFFASEPVAVEPARWSRRHSLTYHPGAVQPTTSPITQLPTEILIHVLRHLHSTRDLYNCMLVSRSWCECSVELLWHKPSFTTTSTLVKMMRVIGSEEPAFTYARFIRRLNFLYLGPELTDALFSRVAQCVRLERLTLVNCKSISDEMLARVLPWFPNLVAIDLTGVSETNDKAIIALASSSKRLQGINLGGCKRVTDRGVLALAGNCALLRRVKLSGVEHITDATVSALAKACPLLLEIDLNNCKRVTDHSVRNVWTQSYHMREMRLSHVEELTDSGFPASPRVIAGALSPNPQAPNPFPSSSAKLFDEIPPLIMNRRFEHLRMLDLTSCSQLTDDAIDGIITNAPKIRNLVLARCSQITDSSVDSICKLGKHLHYLHLGHCSNITDSSVKNLARSCTRLRYIDFASA
jgi:F-box and leucine-rich repeat protein GRR1